jgi:hypothetical protein
MRCIAQVTTCPRWTTGDEEADLVHGVGRAPAVVGAGYGSVGGEPEGVPHAAVCGWWLDAVDRQRVGGLPSAREVEEAMKVHPSWRWRLWVRFHPWTSPRKWLRGLAYRWRTRKCPPPF